MVDIQFNRYYRYEELTRLLQDYVQRYPDLIHMESIGKSHEGRDIWLLTVTNFKTGQDHEKPAVWVDGNIHATELSGSTAFDPCRTAGQKRSRKRMSDSVLRRS